MLFQIRIQNIIQVGHRKRKKGNSRRQKVEHFRLVLIDLEEQEEANGEGGGERRGETGLWGEVREGE